jgi:hypothetical protein
MRNAGIRPGRVDGTTALRDADTLGKLFNSDEFKNAGKHARREDMDREIEELAAELEAKRLQERSATVRSASRPSRSNDLSPTPAARRLSPTGRG